MIKHKWKISPRGRKSKYYDCINCGEHIVAGNKKEADEYGKECEAHIKKWERSIEIIKNI